MVLGPDDGRALLKRWESRALPWASWDALGTVEPIADPHAIHRAKVLELIDREQIAQRDFAVVVDACHGAGGPLAGRLLRAMGCRPLVLGGEPDGRYNHSPEPTEANLRQFAAIVPAAGAAVGFAQDPDADRLAIIDETGRYIGEELTLALAARRRLEQERGPVVTNLSTSRVTADVAASFGCPVQRTPVGEIHVVEAMARAGAILGGEGNGGVIDPRVGLVRDSFVAMALVLDLMATTGEPLSNLVDRLPPYAMVKEKYPLGDRPVAELFDAIVAAHPDAQADRRDGLRLDWKDCWAHVRASNTEPIVRVIAEASDLERAHELSSFLGRWLQKGS
jgi:phosphomannomutase